MAASRALPGVGVVRLCPPPRDPVASPAPARPARGGCSASGCRMTDGRNGPRGPGELGHGCARRGRHWKGARREEPRGRPERGSGGTKGRPGGGGGGGREGREGHVARRCGRSRTDKCRPYGVSLGETGTRPPRKAPHTAFNSGDRSATTPYFRSFWKPH